MALLELDTLDVAVAVGCFGNPVAGYLIVPGIIVGAAALIINQCVAAQQCVIRGKIVVRGDWCVVGDTPGTIRTHGCFKILPVQVGVEGIVISHE